MKWRKDPKYKNCFDLIDRRGRIVGWVIEDEESAWWTTTDNSQYCSAGSMESARKALLLEVGLIEVSNLE